MMNPTPVGFLLPEICGHHLVECKIAEPLKEGLLIGTPQIVG